MVPEKCTNSPRNEYTSFSICLKEGYPHDRYGGVPLTILIITSYSNSMISDMPKVYGSGHQCVRVCVGIGPPLIRLGSHVEVWQIVIRRM